MYNKKDFKSLNMDAAGDIFFARQLEEVQAKIYEFQYPKYKAFEYIPIDFNVNPGAQYVTVTQYQSIGHARIIRSYADDLPNVGVIGSQLSIPVVSIGTSYRYSYDDIRAARFGNVDLNMYQAIAARKANDQLVNDLGFNGDTTVGMYGMFNNPNVPTITVPNTGTGNTTEWVNKTPDQILSDMNFAMNQVFVQSNGVERPNTMLLPLAQYALIQSTPRSANSDTTILKYFLANNEFVQTVDWVVQLAGAGTNGADIMFVYDNDEYKVNMKIPLAFTQYNPQERNLEFVINCESKFAGVSWLYPLSAIRAEGI